MGFREIRYKSGFVVLNEEEATGHLDILNMIDNSRGRPIRPLIYGDLSEVVKFLKGYAEKRADILARDFHCLDSSVDCVEMPDLDVESWRDFYFFCVVDVALLSAGEVLEFISYWGDSLDRGFLCGVPKLNWLKVMTSHCEACGTVVFKNVAMASGRLLSLIRDIIEGVWSFGYSNRIKGAWDLYGCDNFERDDFKIDPRLQAATMPFYYEV
jgi:hypothetical protein